MVDLGPQAALMAGEGPGILSSSEGQPTAWPCPSPHPLGPFSVLPLFLLLLQPAQHQLHLALEAPQVCRYFWWHTCRWLCLQVPLLMLPLLPLALSSTLSLATWSGRSLGPESGILLGLVLPSSWT